MKRMFQIAVVAGAMTAFAPVFAEEGPDLAGPEQQAMSDTVQYALEENKTNQSSEWVNPDTGNSGGVTPTRTFADSQGQPCREFISTVIIGGQQQQAYGTACRQSDGSWQIQADEPEAAAPSPPAVTYNYIDTPPPAYYVYPSEFYYPYHIYLSFGLVYRGVYVYRGRHFLNGPTFRRRYPYHVQSRIFISPRDTVRYHRLHGWWTYRSHDRERIRPDYGRQRTPKEWRNRDHGNGHGHRNHN